MLQPVAESADVDHDLVERSILMLQDDIADRAVEIQCRGNDHGHDDNADEPVNNRRALHKGFSGRYFETCGEIGNSQLHSAVFRMRSLSHPWNVERSADRPRRAAFR